MFCFFFSSRRRHTRCSRDWSSHVCSSDLILGGLDTLSSGRVIVDGVDLAKLSENDLVRYRAEKVGFVFQQFHLVPYLTRSEEHTSELQSRLHLVCRLLLEKKKKKLIPHSI